MPACWSSLTVTLLSSQAIRSADFSPSSARAVMSPRLPIGVAIRTSDPCPDAAPGSRLLRGWLWLGFMRTWVLGIHRMMQAAMDGGARLAKRWLGALLLTLAAGCAGGNVPPPSAPSQPAPTLPQYETVPATPVETGTKIGLLLPLSGQ